MEYVTLGRTGLKVSALGYGCGGASRAGQNTGCSEEQSADIIRRALDNGVNIIDTAQAYKNEHIVGKAIKGRPRDQVVISTKMGPWGEMTEDDVRKGVEEQLQRLDTDYIDIFLLHGMPVEIYDHILAEVLPAMQKMREEGKIRFLGVTEAFERDRNHPMTSRVAEDGIFDILMVGFNLLNQSARHSVLPNAIKHNMGVLNMFAVRRAMSDPARMKEIVGELVEAGQIDGAGLDMDNPVGFLIHDGGAASVPEAAYRFCCYEPGIHVVFSGTGNPDHLDANIEALSRPPLPAEDVERVKQLFAGIDNVTGG